MSSVAPTGGPHADESRRPPSHRIAHRGVHRLFAAVDARLQIARHAHVRAPLGAAHAAREQRHEASLDGVALDGAIDVGRLVLLLERSHDLDQLFERQVVDAHRLR